MKQPRNDIRVGVRTAGIPGRALLLAATSLLVSVLPADAGSGDFSQSLVEEPPVAGKRWEFELVPYAWMPALDGEVSNGASFNYDFDDVLDNLEFAVMIGVSARYDRWSVSADITYMALEDDLNQSLGPITFREFDLTGWIITPTLGYRAWEGDRGHLELTAGVRYLWLKAKLKIDEGGILGPKSTSFSDSGTNWDGVVGFRGEYRLTERFYVPFLFDIGAGDSDLTWQAFGGLGYRFNWGKLFAGYRYMDYELQGGAPLKDLDIGGAVIGAVFSF